MITEREAYWGEYDIRLSERYAKQGKKVRVQIVQVGKGNGDGVQAADIRQN